jgi:Spy/CpxP family protein refolding chaperone
MNNNREKILIFIILFLVLVNSATLIMMWMNRPPFPPHHGRPGGPPDEIIIERLELDETQIKEFEKLKHEHHSQMMKINEESKELHKKYFELLESESVNDSIADVYEKQLANLSEQREEFTFIHFKKLKEICKPEQIKLFNDFVGELSRILGAPKGPPPPRQ